MESTKKIPFRYVFALACTILPPIIAGQNASQSPPRSETVLRVTTRLVLVDTVVVDKAGKPITNLTEKDFTVLEDGKPQKIASFSAHQPVQPTAQPPILPPHVTTNRPEAMQMEGTAAVLLLDGLNTPPQNQVYVRQQMLKFLASHFDPSYKIAVLALTNKVVVLQDFTSNPMLLKAALDRYAAQAPALARNGGERSADTSDLTQPVINAPAQANLSGAPGASATDPGLPGSAGGANSSIADSIAYMMRRFEKEAQNFSRDVRVSVTLAALQNIARYMSGQRGRKVLMWFSAGFPISVSGDQPEDMETSREYSDQIRRTTNLLNEAHVVIYSIDARGLFTGSMSDPSKSGLNEAGRLRLGIDANRAIAKEAFERFSIEGALERAAVDTGGQYFHDRNDIDRAISLSLQESGAYYMLGYYSSQKKWDGKFRQIKIKVDREGLQVRHRRGYFAVDQNWRKGHDKDLTAALTPGNLPSTEVLFMARALPPARNADVNVEFLVDPATILFETKAENQQYCNLNFEVQAFTPEGKLVKAEVQSAEAPLLPKTFERVQKQGMPMQVPIKLPLGRYILHLGVRDNLTGLFGTAELPIDVGASLQEPIGNGGTAHK